jgi:hypothetical protein
VISGDSENGAGDAVSVLIGFKAPSMGDLGTHIPTTHNQANVHFALQRNSA